LQAAGDWAGATEVMVAARRLEAVEVEGLIICANTMHLMAPLIHVADPTAAPQPE
jgi:aspartate/glutamate racemase